MCGRFTLTRFDDILAQFPWIKMAPPDRMPRYNIAPAQPLLAITNEQPKRFDYLTWGFVPSWAKDPSIGYAMFNAWAETLADKPAFQKPLRRRRCLIPADGFYEWKSDPSGRKGGRLPMYIRMKDRKLFAFAGLWEHWQAANGTEIYSCAIITTMPNELIEPIQDRMPAIMPPERYREWLDPQERDEEEMLDLLAPHPAAEMEAHLVSTTVNSPRNETAQCIEPVAKETLF
jgi:putative SOS response-associated peptidase YedK